MAKPEPIKRWIQLETTVLRPPLGPFGGIVEGPFDEKGAQECLRAMLKPQVSDRLEVTTQARVLRVEVGSGHIYARSGGRWVPTERVEGLPLQPTMRGTFRKVSEPLKGYLVFSKFLSELWLVEFIAKKALPSSRAAANYLRGSAKAGWTNALVIEATLVPGEEVGVDMELVGKVVPPATHHERLPRLPEPALPPCEQVLNGKPMIGFRAWYLHVPSKEVDGVLQEEEPRLIGLTFPTHQVSMYVWRDSEVRAECNRREHVAPAEGCDCGLYAFHKWDRAREFWRDSGLPSVGTVVRGAVLGSGDVFVYDDGWRAEVVNVIGFSSDQVSERFLPALQQMAEKFDVPIVSTARLQEIAGSHGRSLRKSDLEGV